MNSKDRRGSCAKQKLEALGVLSLAGSNGAVGHWK